MDKKNNSVSEFFLKFSLLQIIESATLTTNCDQYLLILWSEEERKRDNYGLYPLYVVLLQL